MTAVTTAGADTISAIAGLLGLAIGSFFNVVVYRLPRRMSLLRPGSACPSCGAPIQWYDNIPVVSWIVLRARCRQCHEPISIRYPLIELATGVIFVVVALLLVPT